MRLTERPRQVRSFAGPGLDRRRARRRDFAVAAATGALLTLAFPEPDIAPLAWIAMAPLLLLSSAVGVRRGFGLWLVFGLAFMGTLLSWISIVGWIAWVLLVALQAAFIGAFGALWAIASRIRVFAGRVVGAAALWVTLEYVRSLVPVGGFTWGQIAQSQHDALWLLRAASWGGGWAVAFLVVAANASLAEAWRVRGSIRRALPRVAFAGALVAGPLLLPPNAAGEGALRVAIVQGNVPRSFEGTLFDKEVMIVRSHERLTRALNGRGIDLVVWPESSVGLDPRSNPLAADAIAGAARGAAAPMLVGGNLDVGTDRYKVMVFEVDPRGDIVDSYQKTHLVPFGEYVPARPLFDWLPQLEQVPRDAIAGDAPKVFDVAGAEVAAVISFEGDFGSLVRQRIARGGRFLVVATNTSTWEESWASAQHVAFSQVRAAENGVWVAHGALSGISAFIDPTGRVVERTPLWTSTTILHDVGLAAAPTFYARTGDWLPVGAIALAVVAVAWGAVTRPPIRYGP